MAVSGRESAWHSREINGTSANRIIVELIESGIAAS
jgi:hypothetical protein